VEVRRVNVERQLGMSTRLFVGNLAYSTMDHQLEAAFAQHGQVVSANVVVDRATGRSRGFGFVEFENENEAKAAIEALDGSTLDGRPIAVNEARPRTPKRDDWSGGGGGSDRDRKGGGKRGRGGGGRRGGW
jgi:cold-inducible RNA-binding protein